MARKLRNWLLGYRDYTQETESPESFHMWVGMSVISAATRRNVYLPFGHFTIYPNLYVLLVAPPGECRKSTAMGYGKQFLKQVPNINIEANKMSPQSLIHSLGGATFEVKKGKNEAKQETNEVRTVCAGVLYSPEFSVTLGADAQQSGLLSLLTDLFDSPDEWEYKTLSRGKEILNNVYLNILGATTPDYLATSIPSDAIGGGFASRMIFIAEQQSRKRVARPRLTLKTLALKDDLVHDLLEISNLSGPMTLTSQADDWIDNWYESYDRRAMDERFRGYMERRQIHLLKVAMVVSLSFSNDLIITQDHLEMALRLLELAEAKMPDAFVSAAANPTAKDLARVLEQFKHAKELTWSQLVDKNKLYNTHTTLRAIVETLVMANVVRQTVLLGGEVKYTLVDRKPKTKPVEDNPLDEVPPALPQTLAQIPDQSGGGGDDDTNAKPGGGTLEKVP